MLQSSMPIRPPKISLTIIAMCLCLTTGCAFSKNLLGKSKLQHQNLPAPTAANPETATADCAAPSLTTRPNERTAFPVAPQTAADVAAANNGTLQQQAVLPQTILQQPEIPQPLTASPAMPSQAAAFVQQSVQQQIPQPVAQPASQVPDFTATTQAQMPLAPPFPAATAATPEQFQATASPSPGLPPAIIEPSFVNPKQASGPEMTAVPASAMRTQATLGSPAVAACPPGMVPVYGLPAHSASPPEKLAECEKQVYEMNQKLSELQFDTMKAKLAMEQMAQQQKQLLIDNERLRQRAEMADQQYLEQLDSLSEIVGEVVSQTGSANKSSSAAKPSRGTNPPRTVPQSAAGQSL